jgi:hypothetical protein
VQTVNAYILIRRAHGRREWRARQHILAVARCLVWGVDAGRFDPIAHFCLYTYIKSFMFLMMFWDLNCYVLIILSEFNYVMLGIVF